MYRNILIPVVFDDDRNTGAAIAAAKALADKKAKITLMHVIEVVPAYVAEIIPSEVMATTRKTAETKLAALAESVPGCETTIVNGKPGPRISRWAEENGSDCIVVASHQPALSDILLGSVAHHVVRHAKCAVHVVR